MDLLRFAQALVQPLLGCFSQAPPEDYFYKRVAEWSRVCPRAFGIEYLSFVFRNNPETQNYPDAALTEVLRRISADNESRNKALDEYERALRHIERTNPAHFTQVKLAHIELWKTCLAELYAEQQALPKSADDAQNAVMIRILTMRDVVDPGSCDRQMDRLWASMGQKNPIPHSNKFAQNRRVPR